MSTTTAADLTKEIQELDHAVHTGLMNGDIVNVMKELRPRIVSPCYSKTQSIYLLL